MKIAIRMDDISPDMDWERFFQVKRILDEHQVKPLIGVVTCNKDENLICNKDASLALKPKDFYAYIKSLQEDGWEVSLHGCEHMYTTKKGGIFPLNNFAEFAGVPLERQIKMIEKSNRELINNGIRIEIFMAPAHAYDKNTLKALTQNGFHIVTDGFGNYPYKRLGITFYPISFRMSDSLKKESGYTTMVLHAGTMKEQDMERLKNNLEAPAPAQFIDFSEYLKVVPKPRGLWGNMKEYLLANLKRILVRMRS